MFNKIFKKKVDEEIKEFKLTAKNFWFKSKIVITQYVAIITTFLQVYGNEILSTFNENSTTIQNMLNSKMFSIITVACGLLTIYLRFTSKNVINKE